MSVEERLLLQPHGFHSREFLYAYIQKEYKREHMDEIRELGATAVLFTVWEEHATADKSSMHDVVSYAKSIGLDAWFDLWGLGRVMGGEAPSPFANKHEKFTIMPDSQNSESAFMKLAKELVDIGKNVGMSTLFVDEPHVKFETGYPAGTAEYYITLELARYAKLGSVALKTAVCMTASKTNFSILNKLAATGTIDYVGMDAYYQNYPGQNTDVNDHPSVYQGANMRAVADIAKRYGLRSLGFVQKFGLKPDTESEHWSEVPLMMAQAQVDAGADVVGVWAHRIEDTPGYDTEHRFLHVADTKLTERNLAYLPALLRGEVRYDLSCVPTLATDRYLSQ